MNNKSLKSNNAPSETLTVRILSQLHLLLEEWVLLGHADLIRSHIDLAGRHSLVKLLLHLILLRLIEVGLPLFRLQVWNIGVWLLRLGRRVLAALIFLGHQSSAFIAHLRLGHIGGLLHWVLLVYNYIAGVRGQQCVRLVALDDIFVLWQWQNPQLLVKFTIGWMVTTPQSIQGTAHIRQQSN